MKCKVFLFVLLGYIPASFAQQPVAPVADSNLIKTLYFAGLRDKLNEDYIKAAESFNKILTLDPNNAAVHYEVAILNYKQNKLQEAEFSAKKAASLDTNNLWYWKLLTELYKRKGDMDGMTRTLDQLIRLDPDNEDYYFDHSNALLLAGKTTEALKGYNVIEKKFGSSAALTEARERISLGGESTVGHKAINKTDTNTVDNYDFKIRMIENQMSLAKYNDVIRTAEDALSIYPNQGALYYYMALAQHHEGKNDLALTNMKACLQLDVENGTYLEFYGDLLFLTGDKEAALVQWKKAKAMGNDSKNLIKKINEKKYSE